MVPGQQGHWRGSPPQTLRMRSRQRGRMSRARHLGGAGMRRIWAGGGFTGGISGWDGGHAVEAAIGREESVGGEEVEVGVENEVVTEGVDSGNGPDATLGEAEADPEGVLEGDGGGVEEKGEELAAFAEDAAQDAGDGEDELAVRDFVADGGGDPVAGGADAALVAGGAEVAALAGEGEEAFVAAVRALEAGEAGGEVAAAEERTGRWRRRRKGAGRGICGGVFGSRRGSRPSRGGRVARGARRGDGGVGRRKTQKVFIRTYFVRGKIERDESDIENVRKGEGLARSMPAW